MVTELGIKGTAGLATYKGDEYIILSGYAGLRKILTGTRYKADNAKVIDLLIGRTRLIRSAIKGSFLTIVLVAGVDVLDCYMDDKMTKAEMGLTVSVDVMKAAGGIGGGGGRGGGGGDDNGAPCGRIPVAVGIGVGIAVGVALDAAFPTHTT